MKTSHKSTYLPLESLILKTNVQLLKQLSDTYNLSVANGFFFPLSFPLFIIYVIFVHRSAALADAAV